MESVHKWVLLLQKKIINAWTQWTSKFFDQHNKWIEVVQVLSMVWWLEAYNCENKLVFQLESKMIVITSIKSLFVLKHIPFFNNSLIEDKDNFSKIKRWEGKKKVILYDCFWLFTKKLKLNKDQIKTPWTSIIHCISNTYKNHIQWLFFFPITEKLQYAGIVGKIKIDANKNKNFRVIRVNYLDLGSIVVNWVTSPCKNILLLQLLINFFPFFPLKEIKSVSIVEGEAELWEFLSK